MKRQRRTNSRQSPVVSRQLANDRSSTVDGPTTEDGRPATGLATDDYRLTTIEGVSRRVVVERIEPSIDGGRFPIKRSVGESVDVSADIFADGHDVVVAIMRHRQGSSPLALDRAGAPREVRMTLRAPGTDRWTGSFVVDAMGWHEYSVVAWIDPFRSWQRDTEIKAAAGQNVALELLEGSLLVRDAARRAEAKSRADADWLFAAADALHEAGVTANLKVPTTKATGTANLKVRPPTGGVDPARTKTGAVQGLSLAGVPDVLLAEMMDRYADRSRATESPTFRVWVDRERARFGAWYEMFPRSAGSDPRRSATFREACARLTDVADLGFDVVYLPPIHPIGHSFRKGRNNSLVAAPDDPGSPWAIGSEAGGHTAVDPALGTLEDFDAFRGEAERLGLEVALDLAWQCSPDHPWVTEHPEWFRHRPDGSIKYAENPPKKYQDIYPFDFESEDWSGLWQALLDVVRFWIDRGIRLFRVDNPHTKTFGFWEWLIDEVHRRTPEVVFLSEAFTRPALMRYLAKAGFSQSYTYFTWRNTKMELTDYFTELTTGETREYLRPNLFANTPDILHAYLQHGGRPAFEARLLLAATLGANYGIYSGFEFCENRAVPGTEEYEHSEKYQIAVRDWSLPGIKELIARVNDLRHRHRALQFDHPLSFHATDNGQLIAYSKPPLFIVVNLDPHHMQHGMVQVPLDLFGLDPVRSYTAHDLLDDIAYSWRGAWNYVRLEPGLRQGHIFEVKS
jgi:starch synthase (maltosyl-transferring)